MNDRPPLYAIDAHDIAISGRGTIDGHGEPWWAWKGRQTESAAALYTVAMEGVQPQRRLMHESGFTLRPSLIHLVNCRRVRLEGITVLSGPMWTVHPAYCTDVCIQNIALRTTGHNNDGVVPDSCSNVLIEDCSFSTGDDCIVIKSGLNEDGLRVAKPSESIVIRNCRTAQGHGGIVIGSELSGGVRKIYAHDC